MSSRVQSRIDHIVNLFKTKNPTSKADIERLGIKLRGLDSGVFRKVFKITGVPLVVKIPQHSGRSCRRHALAEHRAIRKINREKGYEDLRPFMPTVYYTNQQTGMMLVHYYKPIEPKYRKIISKLIHALIIRIWPYAMKGRSVDIHSGNVAIDPEDGQVKLIDLGYFSDYGKGY